MRLEFSFGRFGLEAVPSQVVLLAGNYTVTQIGDWDCHLPWGQPGTCIGEMFNPLILSHEYMF